MEDSRKHDDTEEPMADSATDVRKPENNSSAAPHTPSNLLNTTLPAFKNNLEWEADRRAVADAKGLAFDRFLKASIIQRADLLRDTLAVAVTITFGALTLYFTSGPDHEVIKTQPLFFISMGIIASGIVANLIARAEIIKHLQAVSFQIENNYLTIYRASRSLLANPTQTNIDSAYRAENENLQFPLLRKRGEYGHTIAIWTIIAGVVGMAASLLLEIHS